MANILFVVGSTALSASDQEVFDRLDANHDVTTVTGAYPGGDYDAIVVSESISSGDIGSYVGVTTPLMCGELAAWDELGLTASGSGGTTSASSLTVVPGTPLSAGLSGSVTAASSSVAWGRPSSGVARAGTVVVNVGGDDDLAVVFYADAGTPFASGSDTMAEKRVAFGFTSDSTVVADENIWKIFDAAMAWMVGEGSDDPGGDPTEVKRLYLSSLPATYRRNASAWVTDDTGTENARRLTEQPWGSSVEYSRPETVSNNEPWVLLGMWVSEPLAEPAIVYPEATLCAGMWESSGSANMYPFAVVSITQGDSTGDLRGTTLSHYNNGREFPTTEQAYRFDLDLVDDGAIQAQAG